MMVRYWPEEFEKDHPETKEWYDEIKITHKELRQRSKPLTFGLIFGSGPKKLAKMMGSSLEDGIKIWKIFQETYSGITAWAQKTEAFASQNGYVELGDGLRLQTPSLTRRSKEVVSALRFDENIEDTEKVKAQAKQGGDARSAVNATIQYWDVLTLKSIALFYKEIELQGFTDDVAVISTIYDSIYIQTRNDPSVIKWVNDTLIGIMTADYVANQQVKLKSNLDVGVSWYKMKELTNNASLEEIKEVLSTFVL